jgi:hypothetical protein
MESYNASTGEFEAWVTNTSTALSGTANTTFYMCYGNPAISTFQGGSVGSAWNSNYVAVYHMASIGTDSTSNGYTLSNSATTATAGQIDGAGSFNAGSPSTLSTSSASIPNGNSAFSFGQWIYTSSVPPYLAAFSFIDGDVNSRGLISHGGAGYDIYFWNNVGGDYDTGVAYDIGAWQYIVITFDGSNLKVYKNGSQIGSTVSRSFSGGDGASITFGGNPNWTYVTYLLDEYELYNIAIPAGWIATEYNNQSIPATFYTMGAEQSNGPVIHTNLIRGVSKISGVSLIN